MKPLLEWAKAHRLEVFLFGSLLTLSVIATAWNLFYFPYYENDEATYTARAWAFITEGRLDVYTYRYDHAPLGWIVLGIWQLLTGGSHFFGSLLESGRVFMLALHGASTVLVYLIARRLSGGSKLAAVVAVIFFALSPLALYFHRRILLDNIMTFWLLVSFFFATQPTQRLKYYILSAVTFGIAVLTKLNAIFIAPAVLYIVWLRAHRRHRLHATAYWVTICGMVIASFFIYALLKGELFAAPIGADGNPTRVSVVDTFQLQLGRGDFAWPWEAESSFVQNVKSWLLKDWSILALGAVSTIGLTVIGFVRRKKQPYILAAVLVVWCYVAFLARGKLVLDLYVVPLLPFLAITIGLFVAVVYKDWLHKRLYKDVFLIVLALTTAALFYLLPHRQYTQDETSNQLAAVEWVKQHVPEGAVIAADNYVYPYLAQEGSFKKVSYFFSTEYDPEIRQLYDNDWRNIEYLVLTHEVVKQVKAGTIPRMKQVLDHAVLLADYREGTSSYIDLPNYISTNGDWAQVYKIKNRNDIVHQDSWQHFKDTFIVDYGQVIDSTNNALSTSSSQAQAMLRAVGVGDKAMFSGLWQWSKDHLRYRADDTLLSWKWERQPDETYVLGDSNTVCDADQLIAYALYLADDKWPNKGYKKEAEAHARDWWRQCVFEQGGTLYIDSSADGSQDVRLLNPGYFRPQVYRYLSQQLPDLSWEKLVGDGYSLIDRLLAQYATVPNWIVLGQDNSLQPATPFVGTAADTFGYDSLQLIPNIAEDYAVSHDPRAKSLLIALRPSVVRFTEAVPSPPANAAWLLLDQALEQQSDAALQRRYEQVIYEPYHSGKGWWGNGTNYRDQVWLWQWHHVQSTFSADQRVRLK